MMNKSTDFEMNIHRNDKDMSKKCVHSQMKSSIMKIQTHQGCLSHSSHLIFKKLNFFWQYLCLFDCQDSVYSVCIGVDKKNSGANNVISQIWRYRLKWKKRLLIAIVIKSMLIKKPNGIYQSKFAASAKNWMF